jgi:hypothetical protein
MTLAISMLEMVVQDKDDMGLKANRSRFLSHSIFSHDPIPFCHPPGAFDVYLEAWLPKVPLMTSIMTCVCNSQC